MKKLILAALFALASTNASAASGGFTELAITHPVTQAVLRLLNNASGNTCKPPVESDVQPMCMGLLPSNLKKPTLVGVGCGFAFKIQCGNGISANLTGMNSMFEVMGPKNVTYDRGGPGLIISNVQINGL